jgi:hypothetical protein
MFAPAEIEQYVRPRGFFHKVADAQKPEAAQGSGIASYSSDRRYYKGSLEGKQLGGVWARCEFGFSLPVPDDMGIFEISGQRRMIVHEAIQDLGGMDLKAPMRLLFRTPTRVLLMNLNEIFNAAFMEFFMRGQPPTDVELQTAIDRWFVTSPNTQEAPETAVGIRDIQRMVYLRVAPTEENRRFHPSFWGVLDPSSTPQGNQVGLSYRMTKGAEIRGSVAVPGWNLFSDVVEDYGIAGCYTPRRMHLMRTGFAHSLPLVRFERPLVGNPGLAGRHLTTAIMNYRAYTGEDAIVISRSAAAKLTAIRRKRERFFTMSEPHLKVKEGDVILPGQEIAEIVDALNGQKSVVFARRIVFPSRIEWIKRVRTQTAGLPALRIDLMCRADVEVETGDKLFTRSAIKGVANVLDDDHMPVMPDGSPVEAVISPESVVSRRAMSTYWEMMANAYVRATGGTVDANHVAPSPTFREFVDRGYGKPVRLSLNGMALPQDTFCGPLYFLRNDNLARERVAAHEGTLVLNGMRLPVDDARTSGQKRDLAKGFAFLARDLGVNFAYSLRQNMHGQHAMGQLIKVLEGGE